MRRGDDLYKSILVAPVVEFAKLEDVLIVLNDDRFTQAEENE